MPESDWSADPLVWGVGGRLSRSKPEVPGSRIEKLYPAARAASGDSGARRGHLEVLGS